MSNSFLIIVTTLLIILGYGAFIFYYFKTQANTEAKLRARLSRVSAIQNAQGDSDTLIIQETFSSPVEQYLHTQIQKYIPKSNSLRTRLNQAGVHLSLPYFVIIISSIAIVLVVFFHSVLKLNGIMSFFLAVLIGLGIPHYGLRFMEARRGKLFLKNFPESLDMMVRAIRSGLALSRGIELVGQEMPHPIGTEFKIMTNQLQLGMPMEDVMNDAITRIDIEDFRIFTAALAIQRETGGSLAEVMSNLARIIRDRENLKEKMIALSAEARATAYIVGAVPILSFIILIFMKPGYLRVFFEDETGHIMLAISVGLLLICIFVLSRLVRFKY